MLDRLRSFRHRERNTYGSGVVATIVLDHATTVPVTLGAVTHDLQTLETALGRPIQQ